MREVTASRFVRATPAELERALDPATLLEFEGSFTVTDIEVVDADVDADPGSSSDVDTDASADGETVGAGTVVTATGPGLELRLRFEDRESALYYTQEGDAGPFSHLETWLEIDREDEGSRVTLRSAVELAPPLPFGDRIAAWKRSSELERAVEAIATEFES